MQDDFRKALRRMAACVSVVTAQHDGNKAGTTVSSVVSVSFDPMSLLVCIHNQSRFHEVISEADRFCINLLATGQEDISSRFSRPASVQDLFRTGNWKTRDGMTFLEDAQASFFLKKKEVCTFGSHSIFIGEICDVISADDISPLIYMDGGYITAGKSN